MSIFSHHKNGYLKKEINRYKIRQEENGLLHQAGEQKNGSVNASKTNGSENGILTVCKHKNGGQNNGNSNGMHKNGEVKEICMNGNHYSVLEENGNVNNGGQKNGKQNGGLQENGRVECGSGSSGSSSINGDVEDTFIPVRKPGRYICRGFHTDIAHLCAETGYLIWIEPKKTMHVLFTYGDTNCDFLCYLEPEVPGVTINYLEPNRIKHSQIFDENDYRPVQIHSGLAASINGSTGTRYSCIGSCLNSFSYAIDSENGQCFIELSVLNKKQMCELVEPISRPFKLNFRLVL
ncbi:unnamed protein product [Trichobilharzia szidati]|nr:unnamed protein product [Trichobilharzia szidati]